MKVKMACLGIGLILTCCSPQDPLVVKQFTVRDVNPDWNEDLMVRGEVLKRLHGAIDQKERENRKGHYYSVRWRADPADGPIEVRFQYRQASTGSRLQQLTSPVVATKKTGVVEFAIAGENYRLGGRVLAWRMQLLQNGEAIAEEKSFLWE